MNTLQIHTIDPKNLPPVNLDSLHNKTVHTIEYMVTDPHSFAQDLMRDAINFGVKVVAALAIYVIGTLIIRFIHRRMQKSFARKGTDGTIVSFTLSLTNISLYILLIAITVGTLGVNTTSFAALLAAGGMAIGMALSGTVQNFAGGIILLIFKPFKAGDVINAAGYTGIVKSVTIMNTALVTPDGHIVTIPNASLSNGTIDNFTANGLRRIDWKVNVEYGSDSGKVIELLTEIVTNDPRVLDSKTKGADDVMAALFSMNNNDISFIVRAWVDEKDYWPVYFDLNKKIYETLPQNGFVFAFPQLDLKIKNPEQITLFQNQDSQK